MDFSALLSTIGQGDTSGFVDLATKKRKNGPPPVSLTPSQTAIGDIVAGANKSSFRPQMDYRYGVDDVPQHGRLGTSTGFVDTPEDMARRKAEFEAKYRPTAKPSMSGTDRAKGVLGALSQPVQQTPDPEVQPVQIYQNAPMAAYQDEPVNLRPNIPKFALGGVLNEGEEGIVGDGGKEEKVAVINGKAIITPKDDSPIVAAQPTVQTQVENRPMSPVPQSANDVQQGHFGTQPVVVTPETTMGVNDQLVQPQAATQQVAQAPQPQLPFNQTDAYKHPKTLEDWKAKETFDSDKNNAQKQSFWKDFGSKLILGANAFFNPQNAQPIVGWGEYKRKQALGEDQANVNRLTALRGEEAKNRIQNANADYLEQKPEIAQAEAIRKQQTTDIAEFKAINDAEYKQNVIALGKDKADELKANNERLFDLKKRGVDQNDQRIKILERRNDEINRHNLETEKQGAAKVQVGQQRESRLGTGTALQQKVHGDPKLAKQIYSGLMRLSEKTNPDKAQRVKEYLDSLPDDIYTHVTGKKRPEVFVRSPIAPALQGNQ